MIDIIASFLDYWPKARARTTRVLDHLPATDLEQMQKFDAPMLSRNPVLHYVFAKMQLAEERGLGLKSLRSKAATAGLPLPSYSYRAPYMVLTIWRESAATVRSRGDNLEQRLSASEREGWKWLASLESVQVRDYALAMQVPGRTAKYHLRRLTSFGLLRRVGAGRATRYEVVRE